MKPVNYIPGFQKEGECSGVKIPPRPVREWWLLIIQRAQLLLHHAVNPARWAALHVSGGSPPSWADWVNRGRPHAPRARHAAEISSTREISASASRVRPDVREINCRLRNCGMLGACSARGLKYIHLFSRTQTRTSPSPPHRRDPSACWIPDEHQPPPPLPFPQRCCSFVSR